MVETHPLKSPVILSKLSHVVRSILENQLSDFYRNHLSGDFPLTGFCSFDQWRQLPFLTREIITAVPLWERVFRERDDIFTIRNTGGTSERTPLFVPRRTFGDYGRTPAKAGVNRALVFSLLWFATEIPRRAYGAVSINADHPTTPQDFERAARLAALFEIDCVFSFPSTAISLAPYLEREGIREQIRVLELTGERCSRPQLETLNARYNNPIIIQNYGASEWAGVFGLACSETIENRLNSFHIMEDDFFCEFIDPYTGEQRDLKNGPAELVVSSLSDDQPFPLIRYRTGDVLMLDSELCDCEYRTPRFSVVERANQERVRLPPGEFSVTLLEEAFGNVGGVRSDEFEAHYVEENHLGIKKPGLQLFVVPVEPEMDFQAYGVELAHVLRISATQTYADAVALGVLFPLSVSRLEKPTITHVGKRRQFVIHSCFTSKL